MHNKLLNNLVVIFAVAVAMVLLLRRIGTRSIVGSGRSLPGESAS
jgi:hypothetical protein